MKRMKTISYLAVICVLAVVNAVGCSSKPYLPEEKGEFRRYQPETSVLHSAILSRDVRFAVLLPADYRENTSRRYPVVYMLHGYGDNYTSWNGRYLHANERIESLEKNGTIGDMIYVFPDGYTSYYCNTFNGMTRYMDMFVEELVPLVDKSFRTIADRGHRALTGYSMGGFGAMVLALKHPELFSCSAPLSMSFRTDAQYMTESAGGWDGQWGRIFGGVGLYGPDRLTDWYKAHNPYRQFCDANRESLSTVNWFLTCGDDEEQLLIANDSLHVILRDRNFVHEFRISNGAHTSSYWMDALNEVLPWMDHCMNGATAWPECSRVSISESSPAFNEDGSAFSSAFTASGHSGQGVLFFHEGLSDTELRALMSAAWSENTRLSFAFFPCNLEEKSAAEWISALSGEYDFTSLVAFAFGEDAGKQVSALHDSFAMLAFINAPALGFEADQSRRYYFVQTDESAFYDSMAALYRSCKRNSAVFEYRTIDASADAATDRLRMVSRVKAYIRYGDN